MEVMNPETKPRIRKLGDYEWICEKTWVNPLLFSTGYTPAHAFSNYVKLVEFFMPEPAAAYEPWDEINGKKWCKVWS